MSEAEVLAERCAKLNAENTTLREELRQATLQNNELKKSEAAWKAVAYSNNELRKDAERLTSEIPKKILAAVNAEQLRCGHIAEAFWDEADKLNADLRVKLTQPEKSMAYMISTQIRAMRWREENFIEKRVEEPSKPPKAFDIPVGPPDLPW